MIGLFIKHGLALINNGYSIIPIPPGRKGPVIDDWQRKFAKTQERFTEIASDTDHRRDGIGILTKQTPAVDIDCYDQGIVDACIQWCLDNIGDAPLRIGNAPKALLLYAADKPFSKITSARYYDPSNPEKDPKRKGQRLEILADGQQFVAYHIHPETKKPYEWVNDWENPLDIPAIDLAVITPEHARLACLEFERLCEEAGWERIGVGSATVAAETDADGLSEITPPEETDEEVERLKSALTAIEGDVASGYDYDQWRNVLFALKWTRWDCAESLAREWSETSDKHNTREFNVVWRGAQKRDRGREITLGSIFKLAKDAGWDSSRAPTAEDKEVTFHEVMLLAGGLDGADARDEVKAVIKKVAEAKLDSSDEYTVLNAIKRATKIPLGELRKQVAEIRREARNSVMKPTHAGYARRLLELVEDESGVEPVACGGALYVYSEKKGIYEQNLIPEIVGHVVKHFDDSELCIRGSDYASIAKLVVQSEDQSAFFDDAPIGLACKGRFYFINKKGAISKEKLDPSHKQRFLTATSPVVKDTPVFDGFLHDTFEGNDELGQTALLQEVFGAILIGYMPKLEKALFLKGPGRSGKSTILKIIRAMFTPDVQCASSPFDWDREYERASLLGKRLNIVGELPMDKPIPSHDFKTITGRDPINARLPYGVPFTFSPTAAHVFSSNHYIYSADHTDAFFARFVVIECANSRAFRDDAIITDLADQIIENELGGIMAWALQGAKRLLENKGVMTHTKTSVRMFAEWMKSSNSVMEFITDEDVVEFGQHKTHYTPRADLYKAYTDWCKESGRRPMSKRRAYEELQSRPFSRFMLKQAESTGGKMVIRGLKLKNENWALPLDDEDDW